MPRRKYARAMADSLRNHMHYMSPDFDRLYGSASLIHFVLIPQWAPNTFCHLNSTSAAGSSTAVAQAAQAAAHRAGCPVRASRHSPMPAGDDIAGG